MPETRTQRALSNVTSVLHGFTVGITADRRWDEQAALFERRRATVIHAPTIRTIPLGSDAPLRAATELVVARPPEIFIAITGLGVRSWFGAADSWGLGSALLAALSGAQTFARGPKASGAMHSLGLEVTALARSERLAETIELVLPQIRPGTVVAVQVDGSGTMPGLERLAAAGATVVTVPVYEWRLPLDPAPAVRLARAVVSGRVNALTFTTGPAVRNWFEIVREYEFEDELLASLNDGPVVLGIVGPACAEVAASCGIRPDRMTIPAAYRLGPLVRAVAEQLACHTVELADGAHVVSLRGSVITVDGHSVDLSDTDGRVFAVLAGAPGAVFTKGQLLRTVWGGDVTDEHLVEVAVARLRQRLGELGRHVVTVRRRGYALQGLQAAAAGVLGEPSAPEDRPGANPRDR
jgi:uroporphyrinogen-III synthase